MMAVNASATGQTHVRWMALALPGAVSNMRNFVELRTVYSGMRVKTTTRRMLRRCAVLGM